MNQDRQKQKRKPKQPPEVALMVAILEAANKVANTTSVEHYSDALAALVECGHTLRQSLAAYREPWALRAASSLGEALLAMGDVLKTTRSASEVGQAILGEATA